MFDRVVGRVIFSACDKKPEGDAEEEEDSALYEEINQIFDDTNVLLSVDIKISYISRVNGSGTTVTIWIKSKDDLLFADDGQAEYYTDGSYKVTYKNGKAEAVPFTYELPEENLGAFSELAILLDVKNLGLERIKKYSKEGDETFYTGHFDGGLLNPEINNLFGFNNASGVNSDFYAEVADGLWKTAVYYINFTFPGSANVQTLTIKLEMTAYGDGVDLELPDYFYEAVEAYEAEIERTHNDKPSVFIMTDPENSEYVGDFDIYDEIILPEREFPGYSFLGWYVYADDFHPYFEGKGVVEYFGQTIAFDEAYFEAFAETEADLYIFPRIGKTGEAFQIFSGHYSIPADDQKFIEEYGAYTRDHAIRYGEPGALCIYNPNNIPGHSLEKTETLFSVTPGVSVKVDDTVYYEPDGEFYVYFGNEKNIMEFQAVIRRFGR